MAADNLKELSDFIPVYKAEYERTQRELSEIELLLRQTDTELEKLSSRDMALANRLRDMESNLDNYSRADIKSTYGATKEMQMRIFMMRSQMEQLKTRQQDTKAYQQRVKDLLDALGRMAANSASAVPAEPAGEAAPDQGEELIAKIILAQEDERLTISRQMHDGPAQLMANIILQAEICSRFIDRDVNQAKSELASLKKMVNDSLQEIRGFIFDLRPMILDDLGLVPTLRRYIQLLGEKSKAEIGFSVKNGEDRMPTHVELTAFRVVQQALNNAVTHAQASRVDVDLEIGSNLLRLSVVDDGRGFNVERTLARAARQQSFGLNNVRQRVDMLHGTLEIISSPGHGTQISASIPFSRDDLSWMRSMREEARDTAAEGAAV